MHTERMQLHLQDALVLAQSWATRLGADSLPSALRWAQSPFPQH